ncbi:MAG: FtsX-like permease family protein [Bacteroidales bacterium]|nr:FtsX-like permease family protein [Bacteroidales bacterium]
MTVIKFIIQSIRFYWRQHLAVFLGTVISTAVLTGALIIGDSVKMSLNKLVDVRLGKTRFALQAGDRFVRAKLASEIGVKMNTATASLLMVQGIAINPESESRINKIQVVGIDSSFWKLSDIKIDDLSSDEAIISTNISQKLNIKVGDEFLLRVEKTSVIPLNAPFSQDIDPSVAIRLKVKSITDDSSMGRFSLKSNQAAPYNVFISRDILSKKLDLTGKANVILVADNLNEILSDKDVNNAFKETFQLEDASIRIRELSESNRYEILSERIFIDEPIAKSILNLNIPHETALTYLVNAISFKGKETPYSFVSAASAPIVDENLKDDEVVVNDWLVKDLGIRVGDSISFKYFIIGSLRTIKEVGKSFIVKGVVPTHSSLINNSLMPLFPGLADAGSCHDWNTGVPIDLDKIRDKDEKYWNEYKGTPKALISMQAGLNLWGNKFGNYTSIRFDKKKIQLEELNRDILKSIKPEDIGLTFTPVYTQGLNSANNSVDFGSLFLSLSFFVIAAGILLTVLIYSLNTESRREEIGILSGLGFERKLIVRIRFGESILVTLLGGIVGSLLGILYNYGLLWGLNSVWQGAVRTSNLEVFIQPTTVLIGAISGIIIALISVYIVTRRKLKQPIVTLIKSGFENPLKVAKRYLSLDKLIAIVSIVGAVAISIYSLFLPGEINAEMFLSAGGLFLIGCIALFGWYLRVARVRMHTTPLSFTQLALKNAGRSKNRSLTTIALLALGTFSIIITGANRKTFYGVENLRQSGTGGFLFWTETTLPIQYNLNTPNGKIKLGLDNEDILKGVDFIQIHGLSGDDASCLNLNQVQRPRILGVNPETFGSRHSFSFVGYHNGVNTKNTWLELKKSFGDDVIPAIADQTVITWGLKKAVGDTLVYLNESGKKIKLLLIAALDNSIFQGNLLIADSLFVKNFPSSSGSRIMLIDAPSAKQEQLSQLLNTTFTDYGIELTPTTARLAEFNSVENTYLTVFMVLGGLGVIIGTFGFGVVLLRNTLERRSEIALMTAIGYRKSQIFRLIFIENLFLLITGLICGITSAFIGILPSILSPSFTMPAEFISILVLIVFISGVVWIYFPARNAIKGKIIRGLREE